MFGIKSAAPVLEAPRAAENSTVNIIAFCGQSVKPTNKKIRED